MGRVKGVSALGARCLFALGWVALAGACQTQGGLRADGLSSGGALREGAAQRAVQQSRELVAARDYATAIPRLRQTVTAYPGTRAALEARYWLGVAYRGIHGYQEAAEVLMEYLRLAPDGSMADAVREELEGLKEEYSSKFDTAEGLERRVREVRRELRDSPDDASLRLELADLYWRQGDYANATKAYAALLKRKPEYAQNEKVRSRVERRRDGKYIPLTPAEMLSRFVKENPVAVVDDHSFKSGRDSRTNAYLYYVVSGRVLNRSGAALRSVRVEVTIYGFGNSVYGSKVIALGRLNAGEARAFSARFGDFDNIENVLRYECAPSFDR